MKILFYFSVWAYEQRKWHANLSGKLTSKLCFSYARLNMLGASGSSRCLRIIVKIVYNKLYNDGLFNIFLNNFGVFF